MTDTAGCAAGAKKLMRIAIIDDHPVMLRGLRDLIADQGDMEVCCQALSEEEAWEHIEQGRPDIALLDLMLQKRNALRLVKRIKMDVPETKVVILSLHPEEIYGPRALHSGADGFISKESGSEEILRAIRLVAQGERYFSEDVLNGAAQETMNAKSTIHAWSGVPLTEREIEVLELMGNGFGTKQIAQQLSISPKTVETHLSNLREKLNVSNGRDLARKAVLWLNGQT